MGEFVAVTSVIAVLCSIVAVFSFWKAHFAHREAYGHAKEMLNRLEASEKLNRVEMLVKQGKFFMAMDEIGMTADWVDDMTLEEAREVFAVRVANLRNKLKGKVHG